MARSGLRENRAWRPWQRGAAQLYLDCWRVQSFPPASFWPARKGIINTTRPAGPPAYDSPASQNGALARRGNSLRHSRMNDTTSAAMPLSVASL